jgi:hypothetical protein
MRGRSALYNTVVTIGMTHFNTKKALHFAYIQYVFRMVPTIIQGGTQTEDI